MDNQEHSNSLTIENDSQTTNNHLSSSDENNEEVTRLMEGDTYPISDNDSMSTDSDTNAIQPALNKSISQDSLINDEDQNQRPLSVQQSNSSKLSSKMSTIKSSSHAFRSLALDEQIKLVKQKKEEAEIVRLQRFQELLKIKEQKWQQQQSERMKKWLQLRNRDTDHRSQVEERRKKREEEAKAKIEELVRREKQREQRITNHLKTQKVESTITMSTDVVSNRRAISTSRLRVNPSRTSNQSPFSNAREENVSSATTEPQRRIPSVHQTNNQETSRRSAKSRPPIGMTQSIHIGAVNSRPNGLPLSRSSHQLRVPTPPVNASTIRRPQPTRPATVPAFVNESRASPSDENGKSDHRHGPSTRPKVTSSTRSKPPTARSLMTTSHSSSSLSTANIHRIGAIKIIPNTSTVTMESQPTPSNPTEELAPVNVEEETSSEVTQSVEPIPIDTITEIINPTTAKREQTTIDEQEYQRKLNQKIREAQQRLEVERQREEERKRQLEIEEYEREQEQIRLVEEQRRVEQERLQRAIEECERENELKRQEEQRAQQQREELERRQTEEAERLQRERQERAKKEEEERIERKRRLDLIMRRTRQVSPTSKQENKVNGHDQVSSPNPMTHSMSENQFSTSSENILIHQNETITSPTLITPTDTPKFKSPLIQSLLNKARNTRSIDNLMQSSMTSSQIMTESMIDQVNIAAETDVTSASIQSNTPVHLSDDDHDEPNGHGNHSLTSSTPMNSYHDRPMETAAAFH